MNHDNHIHYLRRHEIDTGKWDACMDNAPNGVIYGKSFYLDHMTDHRWDALVLDDYRAIMPLTWKRKWGIAYLYQPPFTQQLGVFSREPTPPTLVSEFLSRLGEHFRCERQHFYCPRNYPYDG